MVDRIGGDDSHGTEAGVGAGATGIAFRVAFRLLTVLYVGQVAGERTGEESVGYVEVDEDCVGGGVGGWVVDDVTDGVGVDEGGEDFCELGVAFVAALL